jgi:tetrahydromethanopterin S-methyltransferase subunit G
MQADVLDISPVVVWVIALTQLLTFALTIWNLLSSPSRTNGKRLDEQGKRLDGIDSRVQAVEQMQRAGPTKDDLHRLELALGEIKGEMRAIGASMDGNNKVMERLETIVSRHEDHLLEGKR